MRDTPNRSMAEATWRNGVTIEVSERQLPVRMRLGSIQSRVVSSSDGIPRLATLASLQVPIIATVSLVKLAVALVRTRIR